MSTSQQIMIKITADSRGVTMAFKKAEQETDSFSGKLRRAARNSYFGRLRDDLKKVRQEARQAWQQMSTLEKTTHRMQRVGSLAAGITAAAWVLKEPVKKTMDYDRRLAHLTNIAYSDFDVATRIANKSEIDKIIQSSVRTSGAKRDDGMSASEKILAANSDVKLLKPVLDTALRGAVALDADAGDVSQILLSANKSMKIAADDFVSALDIVTSSTGLGNFEANDLARALPNQMPLAANVFGTGLPAFNKLTALNQVARVNAGTSDEAANNVVNILQKLTSADTKASIADAYKDVLGVEGFDLDSAYVKGTLAGKDNLQTFSEVIERLFTEDKKSQKVLADIDKLRKSGQAEDAIYEAISTTLEGSAIQTVLRDRQALFGYLAYKNNKTMYDDIVNAGNQSAGALDRNFAVIADTNSWQTDAAQNEWEIKTQKAFEPFNNMLGAAAEKLVEFSQAFPQLSTWLTGAGYTGMALGAAGLSASIFMRAGGMGGSIAGGAGGAGGLARGVGGAGKWLGRAAPWLTGAFGLYNAYDIEQQQGMSRQEKNYAQWRNMGSTGGAIGGMIAGAAIGSVVPVIGTAIGGAIGAWLGSSGGEWLADKVIDLKPSANDPRRSAMGFGPVVAEQTAQAITQSGEAVVSQSQAVQQALIAQVGNTKIEGQINVAVSASPLLQIQASAVGNGNTQLNVGKTNTAAK